MTHKEVLDWINIQKVPSAAVLIIDDNDNIEDLDGLRAKILNMKNIIGVIKYCKNKGIKT